MEPLNIEGLVAAVPTPFDGEGAVDLSLIPALVERLVEDDVRGLYVCGSTGEGRSLTGDERRLVTEAYIAAAARRLRVIVQVGHDSLWEAAALAAHASEAGADAISATSTTYHPVTSVDALLRCMGVVASGAPDLPFYYYHIPALTGVDVPMTEFLRGAEKALPSLVGLKYTSPLLHDFQACQAQGGDRYELLWGVDEMWAAARLVGARGAVGSTYNALARLANSITLAMDRGDREGALASQNSLVRAVEVLAAQPYLASLKALLRWMGTPVGSVRPPLDGLTPPQRERLRERVEQHVLEAGGISLSSDG